VKDDSDLRYEIKLVCEGHRLPQARSWVRLHPAGLTVAYPPRRVNNVYLDTPHLNSFEANLAGLCTRQKLRLRWYGSSVLNIQPQLELKEKENLLGRKKRHKPPCRLNLTQSWADILRTLRANVEPEWQMMLQTVSRPVLFNHYRREYYVTFDGAVRVTLDFSQAAYDQRFSLRPNLHLGLPIADSVVIEIKAARDQAQRLQEIAAAFPLPRSRNSKYAGSVLAALTCQ